MDGFKVLFLCFAVLGFGSQAHAGDSFCTAHDKLSDMLNTKFGEQKLGMGLAGSSAMVELFVSAKGTFTLVSTNTDGVACIVGAGDGWEKADPKDLLAGL